MKTTARILVLGAVLLVASAVPARASGVILFDPTGSGGGFQIDLMDPTVGNALSIGINGTSTNGTVGNLLFQANLGLTSLAGNPNFLNGTGGNYFTIVSGFQEKLTSNTTSSTAPFDTTLQFGAPVVDGSTQGFFYIYTQSTFGNNSTGSCFVDSCNGAPTAILSGQIINNSNFTGNFTTNLLAASQNLDQFNGDQWSGQQTVSGGGHFSTDILITGFNPAYFPSLVLGSSFVFATSEQTLPFKQGEPSHCFSSNGVLSCDTATQPGIGTVNGTGAQTVLQTDASLTFEAPAIVPEPASLTLLGLGLVAGSARLRKKLRKNRA